jgi:hypothetical protein
MTAGKHVLKFRLATPELMLERGDDVQTDKQIERENEIDMGVKKDGMRMLFLTGTAFSIQPMRAQGTGRKATSDELQRLSRLNHASAPNGKRQNQQIEDPLHNLRK